MSEYLSKVVRKSYEISSSESYDSTIDHLLQQFFSLLMDHIRPGDAHFMNVSYLTLNLSQQRQ